MQENLPRSLNFLKIEMDHNESSVNLASAKHSLFASTFYVKKDVKIAEHSEQEIYNL